ncbi:MAG: DUF4832 domain-containing protein [Thermoanaerobaculia bacterium]|nr:DUF4832 domain-containing protein [Thermoanaerobaculia bacterium]
MREPTVSFVLCIENTGYPASLEPRKIYQTVEDVEANQQGLLRVIDESGEDYLFPASHFIPVVLPKAAEQVLLGVG